MTLEAEKIQDVLDTIENLERMEDENGSLTVDEASELFILRDILRGMGQICSNCDGTGRIVDQKRINPQSIDQPLTWCSQCGGVGTV